MMLWLTLSGSNNRLDQNSMDRRKYIRVIETRLYL